MKKVLSNVEEFILVTIISEDSCESIDYIRPELLSSFYFLVDSYKCYDSHCLVPMTNYVAFHIYI